MQISHRLQCIDCHRQFSPQPESAWDGELEFTFFRCPFCHRQYSISVTDAALRKNISRYSELAAKGRWKRLTENEILQARKLLEANTRRSRELRSKYLLEG